MHESVCLNCVTKHLAQAMVIHEEEVPMGYPKHIYRVHGHLAEASRESVALYPDLANAIRGHRLKLIDDLEHEVPYAGLLDYVELLTICLDENLPLPGIPVELLVPKPGVRVCARCIHRDTFQKSTTECSKCDDNSRFEEDTSLATAP